LTARLIGLGRQRSSGQVMVIISLALFVMLGAAALAVDIGRLWTTKRLMQSAADAAALAGADELAIEAGSSAISSAAQAAAAQNGFTNGSTSSSSPKTVTVTVSNPPTSGTFKNNSSVVQVTISQAQPTYFMGVLGVSSIPVTVTASAITTGGGSCVYSLDPTGSGAMTVQGTSSLSSACGVYVNSNNSSSALVASGGGSITAPLVGVVGGTNLNGGGNVGITTGIAGFGDPLAYESEPSVGNCDYNTKNISSVVTLNPGVYCQGITINAGAVVTFSPGLYIIDGGGLKITGGTVSGSGVTFYLTGLNKANGSPNSYSGVDIAGNAAVNLSAPCSSSGGGIEGVLFFQDRSITTGVGSTINGGTSSSFSGAMYFPTTSLTYSGTTASGGFLLLVSYDLTISGNATVGNNYSCLANGPLIKNAALAL
jgi:Flp pilus assembly protein TadG